MLALTMMTVVLAADAGVGSSTRAVALANAAASQVGKTVRYDPAYEKLAFPNGDVPLERGVCTDVVVRAFRELKVDLQLELNRDMSANFDRYPTRWGLKHPDPNIDHRRVQNLQTYFSRKGQSLKVTSRAADYWPGDLVTVDVDGRAHIMIVATTTVADGSRHEIVHNIGEGTKVEDRLFEFPITGHYRPL